MIKWKVVDVIQSFEIVRLKKIQTTDSRCFQKPPEVMKFAVCLATYLSTTNKFLVIVEAKFRQGSSFFIINARHECLKLLDLFSLEWTSETMVKL